MDEHRYAPYKTKTKGKKRKEKKNKITAFMRKKARNNGESQPVTKNLSATYIEKVSSNERTSNKENRILYRQTNKYKANLSAQTHAIHHLVVIKR